MPYMVTFTINIPQMLANIPYMDPMGYTVFVYQSQYIQQRIFRVCQTSWSKFTVHHSRDPVYLDPAISRGFEDESSVSIGYLSSIANWV